MYEIHPWWFQEHVVEIILNVYFTLLLFTTYASWTVLRVRIFTIIKVICTDSKYVYEFTWRYELL